MSKPDKPIATVYIEGGKDIQLPFDEAVNYIQENADKIESRHRKVRRKMLDL